jgi:hypothetical protein
MATKTISVNPDFFSNKKKTKKKKLKHSLRTNFNKLQKNFLKEKMIDKIKNFKKKKNFKNNNEPTNGFSDEYTNAVDFMEDIVKKRKTKKKKKQQIVDMGNRQQRSEIQQRSEQPNIINIKTDVSEDLNHNIIKPDPPYGILKKGKKQLYSKYRKSLSNNTLAFTDTTSFGKEMDINKEISNIKMNGFLLEDIPDRKEKLKNLQKKFIKNKFIENNNLNANKPEKFKIKNKKIIKRYLLGKNNKTNKIGILIKNKKTRKLINKDCKKLEKKKLTIIKKFLLDKALIKVGSSAPERVLRDMYMNCYLSGDLKNSGGKNAEEILMHNWNN